jgi:hypothetical protein
LNDEEDEESDETLNSSQGLEPGVGDSSNDDVGNDNDITDDDDDDDNDSDGNDDESCVDVKIRKSWKKKGTGKIYQ